MTAGGHRISFSVFRRAGQVLATVDGRVSDLQLVRRSFYDITSKSAVLTAAKKIKVI